MRKSNEGRDIIEVTKEVGQSLRKSKPYLLSQKDWNSIIATRGLKVSHVKIVPLLKSTQGVITSKH